MKVLMLNGSPHKEGCTWRALCEIAKELEKEGIESEILHIGGQQVWGCMGCGACGTLGKCVHDEDLVNTAVAKMKECDGLIVGSPVHYASASGAITVSSTAAEALQLISRERPSPPPEEQEPQQLWIS